MSDIKPKLILRPGLNLSDKSPSPSTKLMLSHGKPNFTINRSKSRVESLSPPTPVTPEASQMVLKSTTLNGYVKPANLKISNQNEAHQVVLRKTKLPETSDKPGDDEEVKRVVLRRIKLPEVNDKAAVQGDEPEFIKAQRRIAERLAKEDNLDFENRKSGYFTHVMMSPTSTKTFELPVTQSGKIQQATVLELVDVPGKPTETVLENGSNTEVAAEPIQNGDQTGNGTGERDTEIVQAAKALVEEVVQSVPEDIPAPLVAAHAPVQNGVHASENGDQNAVINGIQNGDIHKEDNKHDSTTSAPVDVNFEPKTVTSVAKELSNEPNNYPDTVVVTKQVEPADKDKQFIEDMAKLKFDITKENLEVTPTLRLDSETPVA